MAPVINQIDRVEKRTAPEALTGRGRVSSSDKSGKAGKNRRLGHQRKKMDWNGLREAVDVFA
ncbi:hypothetical protein [Hydrogenophaga sp.]|uniref:hypothetical protein n=1 Tax=Hydrogenophaga sp. TaxID=1904254 RepID=UPI003D9BDE8D